MAEDGECLEINSGKQPTAVKGNMSEGTPPPYDPWKVLSRIKGKISKTFETFEKLPEIKSDSKKRDHHNKESSNISDSEDFGIKCKTTDNTKEHAISKQSSTTHCAAFLQRTKPEIMLVQLKNELLYQLTYWLAVTFSVIFSLYYLIPLPEYFRGIGTGIFLTVSAYNIINMIKRILTIPPKETMTSSNLILPVLETPAAGEHAAVERFEGWLNELPYTYNHDNYHVARTKSVYLTLEGEILRIMETKIRVPKKAMWDEPKHSLKFTRRRTYNLTGGKVDLLPDGLIRRRRWSKKYPICITLKKTTSIENIILKDSSNNKIELLDGESNDRILKWHEDDQNVENVEKCEEEESEKQKGGKIREGKKQEEAEEQREEKRKEREGQEEKEEEDERNEEEEEEEEEEEKGGRREEGIGELEEAVTDEEEEEEEETDEELSRSKETKNTQEKHSQVECDTDGKRRIFIFARTDRQKEDWYRRLVSATVLVRRQNSIISTNETSSTSTLSSATQQNANETKSSVTFNFNCEFPLELNYNAYMTKCIEALSRSSCASEVDPCSSNDTIWMNCLLARLLFDVHRCPDTINLIQDKIQRKLSNIKLPYFMESLLVSEVAIGQGAPVIHKVTKPVIDERGLWIDLNITYKGCLTMTVETKLNLMKLTRIGPTSSNSGNVGSPMFDSDVEDSPETSTEDDDTSTTTVLNTCNELSSTPHSRKKLLNMVEKLAANKYFQHAAEVLYIRRAMEGVSNTEIRLTVCVSGVEGCLSLNIPPSPSDRLWYGFKLVPKVALTVKPALGERTVNIVYVTNWIETKLLRELEKVVVLPNMVDVLLPLCPNYPYHST